MLLLSEHREPKESSLPLIRLSSCLSPLRPFPAPSNSHRIISFADPHPLNPVVSYRYKNIGGQGPGSSSYFPSTYVSVSSAPSVASVLNPIPLFLPPSRDEKPVTATPSKSTVTNCDARNSFGIRFYENCRVSTPTIPILELTPSAHQPHSRPFFSCTYVEPILQPLCFDIHPCNGGMYTPLALPAIPSSLSPSPIPFLFTPFHTLLRFFALTQNSTLFFSIVSALFAENWGGWARVRLVD
jgi:hypothetical protein